MSNSQYVIGVFILACIQASSGQQAKQNGLVGVPYKAISDPSPVPEDAQLPPFDPDASEPTKTSSSDALGVFSDQKRKLSLADNPCPPESQEFRTVDGSCNNERNIRWGATNRGQIVPWPCSSSSPSGQDRPSPRFISNIVCNQGDDDIPNDRRMSEFVTYFGQVRIKA